MTLEEINAAVGLLAPLAGERQVLLKTCKRDGTWVGTPVSLAVEGDHAYFRTWHSSGKAKRLRNSPVVEIAPCNRRGEQTGPSIFGIAELLTDGEEFHARSLITRRHPLLQGLIVPITHRIRRVHTQHYVVHEITA